jgi:hypothetical protein
MVTKVDLTSCHNRSQKTGMHATPSHMMCHSKIFDLSTPQHATAAGETRATPTLGAVENAFVIKAFGASHVVGIPTASAAATALADHSIRQTR